MKKLLFSVVALAALLVAGSCQKENFGSANGNTVAYTVQLPGNIATKSIGEDVSSVTKLVYAVYRTEAQAADDYLAAETCLYQKTATLTDGQTTLYLEFVNNQNFRVLFWAQDPDAGIYDASNLKNVTIDYTNLDANQESYAAFAGSDFIKPGDNLSGRTVYLHRAVAQLNIATTPESMVLGEAGANETSSYQTPVTLTSTQVTVNGLASTYNVADASVGEILTADFVFDATDPSVLSEQTLTVKGIDYKYISMNYVGFAPALGTDIEVDYVIETNVGTIPNSISSVPVKPNYRTNIIGNLITSTSDYTVILDNEWDGTHFYATDADAAQAALDAAEDGTIIKLNPGVNYGTLLVRPVLGADHTVSGDWITSNYATELARTIENVTILGAEGATVDAIVFDAGYKGSNYIEGAPDLMNYINIKNLVIDGVEFTGASDKPIFVNLQNTNLDGLTVKNCVLDCTTVTTRSFAGNSNAQLVYVYGSQGNHTFTTASKNIVITKNTVEGVLRLCELRETHNVTITDNIINNTAEHAILLASNAGKAYSGSVTISGNTADGIGERFVRMSGAGDAVVEIINNTVNNYLGEDLDYIKVTDGTNVTVESNALCAATIDELASFINNAISDIVITLTDDIGGNLTVVQKKGVKITIEGNDKTYTNGSIKVHSNSNHYADAALTINDLNFVSNTTYPDKEGKPCFNFIEALENDSARYSTNITINNCTFTASDDAANLAVALQIKSSKWAKALNCTATNLHSLVQAQSCDETVVVSGCTITGKNGVAFKQVKSATVEGCTITANGHGEDCGYGIRFDGNTNNYGILVKDNVITSAQPFIVRKMTGKDNTITLEGTNTFTTEEKYQIVITNGSDDAEYVEPTGTYTLTGEGGFKIFPEKPVAKVGNTEYTSIDDAIAAWTNNTTLTLLSDVTLSDVVTLKSTEHHILNLDTYTMTAAEGKNAFVIKACGTGDAERSAITFKADADNPGGINAGKKCVVYYKYADGGISGNDRPIIKIEGGVFTGSTSSIGSAGFYTIGKAARQCATMNISGGTFNCTILGSSKSKLLISGGTFNYSISSQGDQTALRLISGGKFKTLGFMTADSNNTKFWFGTSMANSNVGLYIDDEGYLVVGGPVITEFGDKFAAKATNATKWSSYLQYSSAAEHGLYYTNAEAAIKKHGADNVTLKTDSNE